MKKIILLLGLLLSFHAHASIIPIPDANFKSALLSANSVNGIALDNAYNAIIIDTNANGEIDDTEALTVYHLGAGNASIASLSGLEYFTNLNSISFPHNLITSAVVPLLSSLGNLTSVNLGYNNLTTFTLHDHANIENIILYYNNLTASNIYNCNSLQYLDIGNNSLTSLLFNNNANLLEVDCSYNMLTTLQVGGLPALTKLQAIYNNLTNFTTLNAPSLKVLNIAWNNFVNFHPVSVGQLEELYINNNPTLTDLYAVNCPNLKKINCSNSIVSTFTVGGLANLEHLNCSYNQLTSLVLTGCSSLITLDTSHNLLGASGIVFRTNAIVGNSALSVNSIPTLTTLNCSYNQLTSLNLTGMTNLANFDSRNNPALTTITVDNITNATANPNWFIDVTSSYAVLAAPVANDDLVTVCASNGTFFFDLLANDTGTIDPASVDLDPNTPGQQTTFTDINGEMLSVDSNGILSGPYIFRNPDALDISYTVSDTSGTVSNIAWLHIYFPHVPLVSDLDFSSTPINGITGGMTPPVYGIGDPALSSVLDPSPYFSMVNGSPQITVAAGTPAGTYVMGYGVFNSLVSCTGYAHYAQVTIVVTGLPPTANPDNPHVCPAVQASNGILYYNLTANDIDASGNPVNSATVDLDPATPGIQSSYNYLGTVFNVDPSGGLTAPSAGPGQYLLTYTVNDVNGLVSNIANILILIEGMTSPVDDDFSSTPINGITGGTTPSVLNNDLIPSGLFSGLSVVTVPNQPFPISSTGIITVPPGTAAGTYTVYYEARNSGSPCPNRGAMATIVVSGVPPVALADGQIVCTGDFLSLHLLANDSGTIDPASVDLDPTTPAQDTSIVVNATQFTVDSSGVLHNSGPAYAFYNLDYTVKDIYGQISNVAHINTYFIGLITTTNDDFSAAPINGIAGGTTTSVLDNDTIGAAMGYPQLTAVDSGINSTPNFTINSDGTITIPAGTPPGVYTFTYIAKSAKRADCPGQTGQATIVVTVPAINAVDDAGTVDFFNGGSAVSSVLLNDTLNGLPVAPSQVTTTFISSTSSGILLSGTSVVVAPGTAVGTYSLTYQICEISNPFNCDQATVTVTVICATPITPAFSQVAPICSGSTTASLPIVSLDGISGTWSPAIDNTQTRTYTFTPNAGQCATSYAMTIAVVSAVNLYIDNDGDGYDSGTSPNCSGIVPTGYSLTSLGSDCNDNNALINRNAVEIPGNGVDDNCDGTVDEINPTSNLIATSCGVTLTALQTTLFAYDLASYTSQTGPVQGYRFEVSNSGVVRTYDASTNSFNLMNVSGGATNNTTYQVRVAVKLNGFWRAYGSVCAVTTPALPATTAISSPSCGSTLTDISNSIFCTQIASATGYRFRVRNGATIVGTYDSTVNRFSLTNLGASITFGTTYTIDVLLQLSGVWRPNTEYGSTCNITTPGTPGTSRIVSPACGSSISSFWTSIFAQQVLGAQGYRFVVTNGAQTRQFDTPNSKFCLMNLAGGGLAATAYTIRVDVLYGGNYIQGTQTCVISTTAGASRMTDTALQILEAKAYPNPFADNFKLDINTLSDEKLVIKVYDMLGREIDSLQSNQLESTTLEIGENYPSGVYNIIVTQGTQIKSIRVIKR